jgi:predicted dienelactone hydrolase
VTTRPLAARIAAATLGVLAALLLGACAATAPRPAAVERIDIRIADPADGRELPLRLVYPTAGRALPVVLFSHGAFSSGEDYDAILDAWAARGYVVIAPTHRDSVRLGTRRGAADPRHFAWRLDDAALILGRLGAALGAVPGLAARTDRSRIAATGHSFGGLVAQTLGGATYFDPAAGKAVSRADPRVRAVIVFSGAGPFPPILRNEDFAALTPPTLVTVGTDDLAQAPGLSGYAWRRQPWDLSAPGNKYLLTLDGADHYLGGMVGRADLPKAERGPLYVAAFTHVGGAFLDAFLRDDPAARRWLDSRVSPVGAPASAGSPPTAHLARR